MASFGGNILQKSAQQKKKIEISLAYQELEN
jgi:hypothetical protein